jgi:hypothetical protein
MGEPPKLPCSLRDKCDSNSPPGVGLANNGLHVEIFGVMDHHSKESRFKASMCFVQLPFPPRHH